MAKKSKAVAHEAWRPDFRNAERLPDIKVVRTDFLLNLVTAFIAVAIIGFVVYREYEASALASRVQTQLDEEKRLTPDDRAAQRATATFMTDLERLQEAASFSDTPVKADQYILRLAELLPVQGVFSNVDYTYTKITETEGRNTKTTPIQRFVIRGYMQPGESKSPTQLINEYLASIRDLAYKPGELRLAELASAERDLDVDRFAFTIRIDLQPATEK